MADTPLTPRQISRAGNHGIYVHVDAPTLVVNASQVTIDGAGGEAFVPFTSPAPVTVSVLEKEADTAVDWVKFQIVEHGVALYFDVATDAREARLKLVSGETEKIVPLSQTWIPDRGFSLMTPAVVKATATEGFTQINLQTDKYWTVDCGESWITYDLTYGKGSGQLNVTLADNEDSTVRYGFIHIHAGRDTLTVEIQQDAAAE